MGLSSVSSFSLGTNPFISIPHNNNNNLKVSSYCCKSKSRVINSTNSKHCSPNNNNNNNTSNKTTHLLGLYGQSRCLLKPLSIFSCKDQRGNSIRASAQIEDRPPESGNLSALTNVKDFVSVCWEYVRPYTAKGVIICSSCLFGRELLENPNLFSWPLIFRALLGMLAILGSCFYTAGINQIFDMDIDRINKPDLPLVSGRISVESAWLLTLSPAIIGFILILKLNSGPLLTSLYCLAILSGTIYSVPPFRWKKNPITAFLCILMIHAGLNFSVYYASRAALGLAFVWSPSFSFITAFITFMTLTLASSKDLSDINGDRKFGVETFATKLGAKNITLLGTGLLLLNYVAAISTAIIWPKAFKSNIMLLSHAILAFSLFFQARELDRTNYTPEACKSFYEFIWILFSAEYVVYLFI
ncbi:2-acylphloroglucinol 4-prenyltransferase [Humulus lupulus]|uniref:2-acylphloroglucinol 4-prenyltransferase, chloroplastic n=1 Tax=Humulus lupulus TaxID=3486 RepID=UPI002B407C05|nr:2-acylphloroglucinol 4-prenyltransferase [Humulus lupulus]